jgi:hypothetical protein
VRCSDGGEYERDCGLRLASIKASGQRSPALRRCSAHQLSAWQDRSAGIVPLSILHCSGILQRSRQPRSVSIRWCPGEGVKGNVVKPGALFRDCTRNCYRLAARCRCHWSHAPGRQFEHAVNRKSGNLPSSRPSARRVISAERKIRSDGIVVSRDVQHRYFFR